MAGELLDGALVIACQDGAAGDAVAVGGEHEGRRLLGAYAAGPLSSTAANPSAAPGTACDCYGCMNPLLQSPVRFELAARRG